MLSLSKCCSDTSRGRDRFFLDLIQLFADVCCGGLLGQSSVVLYSNFPGSGPPGTVTHVQGRNFSKSMTLWIQRADGSLTTQMSYTFIDVENIDATIPNSLPPNNPDDEEDFYVFWVASSGMSNFLLFIVT